MHNYRANRKLQIMKRLILIVFAVMSLTAMAQGTKEVSYSTITVQIPASWNASNREIEGIGKMLMITDKVEPSYYYIFWEYNMLAGSVDYAFETMLKENNAELFRGATWGKSEYTTLCGYKAIKANFSNTFWGGKHQCTAYCLISEKNTYVFLFMRKEGKLDLSRPVLNSIKIDVSKSDKKTYRSGREEIRAFHDAMVNRNGFGKEITEGVSLDNLDVSDQEDMLIYEYSVLTLNVDLLTTAELTAFRNDLDNGMLPMVKEQIVNFDSAKRCIDEGFGVIVIIKDINKKNIHTIRYSNSQLR